MVLESEVVDGKLKDYKPRFISWNKNYQPEEVIGNRRKRYIEIVERSTEVVSSEDSEQKLDDDLIYLEYEKKYNNAKLHKVLFLLKKLPTHPYLIKPIFRKIVNLVELIILRLKGRKVRW